jgi:hypothetical protein
VVNEAIAATVQPALHCRDHVLWAAVVLFVVIWLCTLLHQRGRGAHNRLATPATTPGQRHTSSSRKIHMKGCKREQEKQRAIVLGTQTHPQFGSGCPRRTPFAQSGDTPECVCRVEKRRGISTLRCCQTQMGGQEGRGRPSVCGALLTAWHTPAHRHRALVGRRAVESHGEGKT